MTLNTKLSKTYKIIHALKYLSKFAIHYQKNDDKNAKSVPVKKLDEHKSCTNNRWQPTTLVH